MCVFAGKTGHLHKNQHGHCVPPGTVRRHGKSTPSTAVTRWHHLSKSRNSLPFYKRSTRTAAEVSSRKHLAIRPLVCAMAVAQAAAVVAPVMVAAAAPPVCLPSPCQSSRRAFLSRAPIGACRLGWRRRRTLARSARRRGRTSRGLVIVDEFGGSYEEGFEDVHAQIVNYFTYKATNTVLHQLYEMNPPAYTWLYNYVVVNDPKEGKHFLRALAKERQDLAERVMITRLHLYSKWIKKCDHTNMYQRISNENLEIMRERLMETVVWPTDDTNSSDKKD